MLSKVLSGARCRQSAAASCFRRVWPGADIAIAATAQPSTHRAGSARTSRERRRCAKSMRQLEAAAAPPNAEAFEAAGSRAISRRAPNLQPVLERLNASIAEILGMRPDLRRRAETDVVQLALLIAKRVLHRELSVDEERADRARPRCLRTSGALRVVPRHRASALRRRYRRRPCPASHAAASASSPIPTARPEP